MLLSQRRDRILSNATFHHAFANGHLREPIECSSTFASETCIAAATSIRAERLTRREGAGSRPWAKAITNASRCIFRLFTEPS